MKYPALLVIIATTCCYAQDDGPVRIYLKSGKIISTAYAVLSQSKNAGHAFVTISPEPNLVKITIDSVDHIEGLYTDGRTLYVKPVPAQLTWMWGERIFSSDRISIYYREMRVLMAHMHHYDHRYVGTYSYTKDNGVVNKLKLRNVARDVADNPASMKYIRTAKNAGVLQGVLYVAGSAAMIGSFVYAVKSDDDYKSDAVENRSFAGFAMGAICLGAPYGISKRKKQLMLDALKTYQ